MYVTSARADHLAAAREVAATASPAAWLTVSVEFAYVLRPAFDQAFMERATERELRVFEEHGEWLEAGFAEGRVRFAGRCYDGPFGMVVIEADDERHARSLTERDPSVREGLQTAELYPFKTFISRERGPDD